MEERIAKAGSASGLRATAFGLTDEQPVVAEYSGTIRLLASGWRSPMAPRAVEHGTIESSALGIGDAAIEQVGFRYVSGAGGIQEVILIFDHVAEAYALSVDSRGGAKNWR